MNAGQRPKDNPLAKNPEMQGWYLYSAQKPIFNFQLSIKLQLPDPDIPKARRIAVILQHDRSASGGLDGRAADAVRISLDGGVVLNQNTIV